jgi:hypothetical protein
MLKRSEGFLCPWALIGYYEDETSKGIKEVGGGF